LAVDAPLPPAQPCFCPHVAQFLKLGISSHVPSFSVE
jgi:hypothetical protein